MAGIIKQFIQKFNPIQPDIAGSEAGAGYPDVSLTINEAPNTIGIVKRCVEVVCNASVDLPLKIYRMNENNILEEWNTPVLAKFLVAPNNHYDRIQFYSNLVEDLIVGGNAFILVNKEGLYHLPGSYVEILEDPNKFIKGYRYTAAGNSKIYARDNIIHIRLNNSTSVYRGKGKLQPIEEELKIYKAMLSYQKSFFVNSGIPKVILKTVNFLSRRSKERMLQEWRATHNSLQNKANGTAILEGGTDFKVIDQNFRDVDFNEGISRLEQYIATIIGVPWVLLNAGNNANIRNNQRAFYHHTVLPLMNRIASAIEHHIYRLNPSARGRVFVKVDTFSVEALRPDMKEHAAYLATLTNGGIMTPNESRTRLRLDPIEGLDDIRVPANIAGSAVDPSQGGRPSDDKE